jgi:hypothetical protein
MPDVGRFDLTVCGVLSQRNCYFNYLASLRSRYRRVSGDGETAMGAFDDRRDIAAPVCHRSSDLGIVPFHLWQRGGRTVENDSLHPVAERRLRGILIARLLCSATPLVVTNQRPFVTMDVRERKDVVRVGVNYRFNLGSPVVAKYWTRLA